MYSSSSSIIAYYINHSLLSEEVGQGDGQVGGINVNSAGQEIVEAADKLKRKCEIIHVWDPSSL